MNNNAIDDYLNILKSSRSHKTHLTYSQAVLFFVEVVGQAAELTVDNYVKFLKELGKRNPYTQAVYRTAIMGLYLYYASNHPELNYAAIKQANKLYVKRLGKRFPTFDRDAIEKVIQYASTLHGGLLELRDRAFIITLADTGLRISEACALMRGDIDWNEGRSIIVGKGDKQAVIRYSNRSLVAMREYLAARAELDGSMGKPLASMPLFARHDKGAGKKIKRCAANGMWYAVKERIEQAGIEQSKIRIHDFRHYFVTMAYLASGDLKFTQEIARHANMSTTSNYAHLGEETDRKYNEIFNKT